LIIPIRNIIKKRENYLQKREVISGGGGGGYGFDVRWL
jgi:hypothetical protein